MDTQKRKKIKLSVCLAVEYHAYIQAIDNSDHNGVITWGKMLLETAQRLKLTQDDLSLLTWVPWNMRLAEESLQREPVRNEAKS